VARLAYDGQQGGLLCVALLGGPLEDAAAQPKPEGEMRPAI